MKKLIAFLTVILAWGHLWAQPSVTIPSNKITVTPAGFNVEDQVTVEVDFNGTLLENRGPFVMWAFSNIGGAPGNVDGFCSTGSSANPRAVETSPGSNIWRYTFVPVDILEIPGGRTPAEINSIGLIFKNLFPCGFNGGGINTDADPEAEFNAQTQDLFFTPEPLVFVANQFRTFPRKFTENDLVTLYWDANLTTITGLQSPSQLYLYSGVRFLDVTTGIESGNFQYEKRPWCTIYTGNPEISDVTFTNEGSGIWSIRFVPRVYYGVTNEDQKIVGLNVIVRTSVNSASDCGGATQTSDIFVPVSLDN